MNDEPEGDFKEVETLTSHVPGEPPVEAIMHTLKQLSASHVAYRGSWKEPKEWRKYTRQRAWFEHKATDLLRQWYLESLKSWLQAVHEDMIHGGFDPQKADHFAALGTLLCVVSSKPREIAKMLNLCGEFFGHFKRPDVAVSINGDSIRKAFQTMHERYGPGRSLRSLPVDNQR